MFFEEIRSEWPLLPRSERATVLAIPIGFGCFLIGLALPTLAPTLSFYVAVGFFVLGALFALPAALLVISDYKVAPRGISKVFWIFGMLSSAALFVFCAYKTLASPNVSKNPTANASLMKAQLDDPSRRTLLDLFMTEFTGSFTGQTLDFPKEFVFKDGHHERFFESRFYDYVNNSNYMSFYIGTTGWEKIVEYIAKKNKSIAGELPPFTFDAKAEGSSHIVKIEDAVFSGKIFIYIPTIFDIEKLAEISKLGKDNGCFIEIRGTEYEELMRRNLRKYKSKIPAHYDIVNGNPVPVQPAIDLNKPD